MQAFVATRRNWWQILMCSCWILLCRGSLIAAPPEISIAANLLDYIGRDYPRAVDQGNVVSEFEYAEMQEFSRRLLGLWDSLQATVPQSLFDDIRRQLENLERMIAAKAPHDSILAITTRIRNSFFEAELLQVAPVRWPSLQKGKTLYQQYCQSCHGDQGYGDGPAGVALQPPPSDLTDSLFQLLSSPLSVYNTVRLGVEGTAMPAFSQLSEEELWALAFFVKALPYDPQKTRLPRYIRDSILTRLAFISRSDDRTLLQWLSIRFPKERRESRELLAAVRTFEPANTPEAYLNAAERALEHIIEQVHRQQYAIASQKVLTVYLEMIEPLEQFLQVQAPDLGNRIERNMLSLRTALEQEDSEKALVLLSDIRAALREAREVFAEQVFTFGFTFWMATAIIFREGLEALLIIIVILSVLRRLDAHHLRSFVHAGWLSALGIGVVLWFFADALIQIGARDRELLEGVGALVAVVILIYVGFWLHQSSTAAGWQQFVQKRLPSLVSQKNAIGLFILVFVAVFREAAETVIFLSALNLEGTQAAQNGILAGLAASAIALGITAWALQRISQRIPFRRLFQLSSVTMVILAMVLVGKGIHALQEAGYISVLPIPGVIDIPLLGIFATVETFAAQGGIVLLTLILWRLATRRSVATVEG